jgi:hypothetical protein
MEGKAKRPLATPPRVARVLKLIDELEESEELMCAKYYIFGPLNLLLLIF